MESEHKFWACVWFCGAAVLCTLIASVAYYNVYLAQVRFENGYEQKMVEGCGFPVWVKAPAEAERK